MSGEEANLSILSTVLAASTRRHGRAIAATASLAERERSGGGKLCRRLFVFLVGMVGTSSNKEMGSLSVSVDEKNRVDLMAALSSFSYSFCSVSMVMSNKVSLQRLHQEYHVSAGFEPFFFLCSQGGRGRAGSAYDRSVSARPAEQGCICPSFQICCSRCWLARAVCPCPVCSSPARLCWLLSHTLPTRWVSQLALPPSAP